MTEKKPDGPLMKAWREWQEKGGNASMALSVGPPTRAETVLESQLEASLWALCEGIEPMHYQMDVLRHIPHMRGSNTRVRRFTPEGHWVLILCVCKTAMRFARCQYVSYTDQVQCAEECMPGEGILREDVLCSFHRKEKQQ